MDSLDLKCCSARSWLADGQRVMLVTVVRTWGSSPRPPGALLALREDGRAVGSVSGGCIGTTSWRDCAAKACRCGRSA